ncbi:Thioredoxin [Desulfonispora thiosulfatigenes DSM 11270]|uniref:Thioredoxin n=1 Tax=Desulfonispora thiosulfatigenes DSM 11270 TaxID=656914 RepID=A0A1W1V2G1_DESTI|nr:thioredoxin family protein [Desulfonispora thiosulfatigenes]SMB87214.1 Thioredoxin [Desulfonispora thiosulfatigenes DSM 11270]
MNKLMSVHETEDFIHNNECAMLYFSSVECSVCVSVWNQLQNLLKSFPHIKVAKIEVPEVLEVTGEYSIFTVPVVVFFLEGREILRQGRFFNFNELEQKLSRYYQYCN